MKKRRNFISLIFILLAFIAVILWIVSLIVKTASNIEAMEVPYLVYVYYVAAVSLVLYFVVYPFFSVLLSPTFNFHSTVNELQGKQKKKVIEKHYNKMKKFAKKLLNKKLISEENHELLKEELAKKDIELVEKDISLQKLLSNIILNDIKKDIRGIVLESAKDTLYLTSLSQNSIVDVLIVMVNNFRMLKKIVSRCGFRPSFFRLLKFYINVGISSLIAEGAEKLDIQSLLGNSLSSFAKPLVGSLINGSINAFFMLRTGFLASNYIFMEAKEVDGKEKAISGAILEATIALPELTIKSVLEPVADAINNAVINPTKKAVKTLFTKKEKLVVEESLQEVK